ncbi:MAG: hypothetical protein KA004_14720 [Verrucomicrobiales bacterium]|nr:hypothetical protein [Verrucomicrobiales bacterium]
MHLLRRIRFALLLTGLSLSACTSSSLPKVRVAPVGRHAEPGRAASSPEVVCALLEAEAARGTLAGNAAVEKFLLALQSRVSPHQWKTPLQVTAGDGRGWEVRFHSGGFQSQGKPEYSPALFHSITPAHLVNLEAYRQVVQRDGIGVPVILEMDNVDLLRKNRGYRPRNDLYAAATAVLEFGPSTARQLTPVTLRLINPSQPTTGRTESSRQPLAANLTAAVEMNLGNAYIRKRGIAGLLHPEAHFQDMGLFGMEIYDPKKIPVVFVHGLGSDPAIWKNAVNEIYADPWLRTRYLPLLFVYPTGISVPGAAARLRETIALYRKERDPHGRSAAMNRMVVVGHSMGGLLTRLQVVDSGEHLRQAFFTKPLSQVAWLSQQQERQVSETLHFHAQPGIKRVVFIATPHRGSKAADLSIVQWAVRLIKLPLNTVNLVAKFMLLGPAMLNPELQRFRSLGLRSVDMLSPHHPWFKALAKCPIKVPFHSIVADRGKGTGPDGGDGLVPCWSAHLDGAASEKVVPHGHNCTMQPVVVAEICRILRLHAAGS